MPFACNFDPTADYLDVSLCDLSSCAGCTDPTSCTYDPAATLSAPSACTYPVNQFVDCDGNCNNDADGDGVPDEPVDPVDGSESGGILPGFTALTGLASVLGAAILVAGRRKD